jgi:mono/diheme cytochrome c family protein
MSDAPKNRLEQFLEGTERADYEETSDITKIHGALVREHEEPSWRVTALPMWLVGVCSVAAFLAGGYLLLFHGGFRGDVFNERQTSPELLFPRKVDEAAGTQVAAVEDPKAAGKKVYSQNCVACHQASGMGAPGQFPPLVKSEWVVGSPKRLAGIILKGVQGPLNVEGAVYNGAMPPWEKTLNDKKIAAVMTYIRSEWGNAASPVTPEQVASARKEFAPKASTWTEAELLAIPADATLEGGAAPEAPSPAPPNPAG